MGLWFRLFFTRFFLFTSAFFFSFLTATAGPIEESPQELWVLKKKFPDLELSLKQDQQRFSFTFSFTYSLQTKQARFPSKTFSTKGSTAHHDSYYEVTFDDLNKVREIKKKVKGKTVLEIVLYPNENISFIREAVEDNITQERRFNELGYILEDKILFPPNSQSRRNNIRTRGENRSKSFTYEYDKDWNLTTANFYLDGKPFLREEYKVLEKSGENEFKLEKRIYDQRDELKEYYLLTRSPLLASIDAGNAGYSELKEIYSLNGALISTNLTTYHNDLKIREVTPEGVISFYYNTNNQLLSQTIKDNSGSLLFSERYQYQSIPSENYLLFNNSFKLNQVNNKKRYLDEALTEGKLEFYNHYKKIISSLSYYKEGTQVVKSVFRVFGSNLETLTYNKNNQIIKKEIYNYLGERIGHDKFDFYINGYVQNKNFTANHKPITRNVKFLFEELPLSKKRYEICSPSNFLNSIDFNFAQVFFDNFYQELSNSSPSLDKESLANSFQKFINQGDKDESSELEKKWLRKFDFIKDCKIKKIIITNNRDDILAYLRIKRIEVNDLTRIFFDYYKTPKLDFSENNDLDYYENNYNNLVEESPDTPSNLRNYSRNYSFPKTDGRREFLFKPSDDVPSYYENHYSQIEIEHSNKAFLWARRTCFNGFKNESTRLNLISKKIIGAKKTNACPINYFP